MAPFSADRGVCFESRLRRSRSGRPALPSGVMPHSRPGVYTAGSCASRYVGFQPDARLDDGERWPVAFAVTGLTAAGEKRIAELVKKAAPR